MAENVRTSSKCVYCENGKLAFCVNATEKVNGVKMKVVKSVLLGYNYILKNKLIFMNIIFIMLFTFLGFTQLNFVQNHHLYVFNELWITFRKMHNIWFKQTSSSRHTFHLEDFFSSCCCKINEQPCSCQTFSRSCKR